MEKRLNVGVIGAGMIGRVHAEHLAYRIPEARLVAIADVHLQSVTDLGEKLSINKTMTDYHEMLADPGVDAVAICSSTDTHAKIIIEAAAAGKHIFCEKPISYDLRKIDDAINAVNKAGVKLQIGFNRRFDPNFARAKQAVLDGVVGEPHLVHIISRDPEPPTAEYCKTSGGIFMDMTIHDFDMARYIVGKEVVEVYASGGVRIDPEIGKVGDLDTVLIMLKYEDGTLGTIDNSEKAAYGYDQRVEVFGSKGAVHINNNYPNSAIISDGISIRHDLPLYFFVERYTESYIAEVRAFVHAVLHDEPVQVTGSDGRVPVVMGLAAKKSVEENRPVKLSEVTP